MEQQARYNWMSAKRKHGMTLLNSPSSYGDSWEEQAFAEDAAGALGGCIWPPRSYTCSFCRREFRSAQALGGHMNVHRRDRARMKQSSPSNNNPSVHDNHQVFVPPPPPPPPHRHHHHHNSLSCTDSSLLMPHPCRILQKHTSFGESETHPLTYLKSSSNTDNSHIQYPSKICTFVYNPNSDSDLGGPIRVHSSFSSIVQEENKNKLSSPPSSIWSNLVAADKYSCLSNDEEKKLKSIDFKKDIQERNLEVLMIDSSSFRAKQDHVLETNYCKRRRGVDQEDNISFANLFTKTSSSIERCRPQSEALERIPSAIEELDLELRL